MGKKLILSLLTAGLSLFGQVSAAFAAQEPMQLDVYFVPVHFVFDQQEYAPPVKQRAFIYQGSTYVPLRFVSYSLHKAVHWDGDSYTVTVEQPASSDQAVIDDYLVNRKVYNSGIGEADLANLAASPIAAYAEPVHYIFDGTAKEPPADLPGLIIQDSLYVPIRFFSEAIGKKINWDPDTYTVAAQSQDVGNGSSAATPADASGGTPAGSGQQSYDTIEADAYAKLADLQSRAQAYFYDLLSQYLNEPVRDTATKAKYNAQGEAALSGYDQQFAAIIADLSAKLSANHYSTDLVKQYEQEYESEKATARDVLNGMSGK